MPKEKVLRRMLESASFNLKLYSTDYMLNEPKRGWAEEWAQAAGEVEIVMGLLREIETLAE